jgi:sugar fermentation stimulation protein A
MRFEQPLIEGVLLRRYKRFLADVRLSDGRTVTAHTPNTGSMAGCAEPGLRVWLRDSGNPRRKYPYSWELVESRSGVLVGINTTLANRLVRDAIEDDTVVELQGYGRIRTEQRYGMEGSRIDLLLEDGPRGRCYVEVKNVTLVEDGVALFPDAVSLRGTRHLRELRRVAEGARAVVLFCVQRADARAMRPAAHIDPEYARTLCAVMDKGVEALVYGARVSTQGIALQERLGFSCP